MFFWIGCWHWVSNDYNAISTAIIISVLYCMICRWYVIWCWPFRPLGLQWICSARCLRSPSILPMVINWRQWWTYRIIVMIRKAINTKRFWWNPDFADWAWGQHPNGIGYKVSALSSSSRSQIPGIVKLPHDPLPIISRGTLCSVQCAKSSKK